MKLLFKLRHMVPTFFMAAFMGWVLPREAARLASKAQMSQSPDTTFFYSRNELYALAEAYGEAGRQAYIESRVRFDILWPLVYGLFFWHLLYVTWPHHRRLLWLPWLAVALDLLENSLVSIVFLRFPAATDPAAHVAGFVTAGKWVIITITACLALYGVLRFFVGILQKRSAADV
ncbi:MAG: hypothetical protein EA374_03205 [Acholeplasmatales bacterium]|nr:MAG: hypothetical protein EA374_03205 [Acholeplasmatales bacterium]